MTLGPYEVGAFSRSDEEQDRPDIQVYFSAYTRAPGRVTTERAPGFTIATHIVQTSSIGSVHVSSADPAVASTISPNYLHHDADRRRAVAAVRFLRALVRQPAFARYVGDEIAPGARVDSDDAIVDAVLRRLSGGTHALGTCAMGREQSAVLDGHLRVRGVRGTAGHRLLGDARPGVGEHQRTGHGAGLAGLRSHRRGAAPLTTRRRATRFVPTTVPPAARDLTRRDHPRGRRPDGPLTRAAALEAGDARDVRGPAPPTDAGLHGFGSDHAVYHRPVGSTAWLTRRWLRRRRLAVLPVALVVGVGGAATMLAIAAADRTATTYADYLDRSDVGDVVINPAMATQEIDAVIRNLPGVERVTTSALLTVSFEEGQPMLQPGPEVTDVIDDRSAFVLGSHDGRYFDMDRPAVNAGRMPTGPSEAVVTPQTAAALDIEIGDVVPMSFWAFGLPDGLQGEALERYQSEIVAPIGVEHVTITGIVTLADEVLPDELYPRQRAIVSPDLAERYDCIPPEPPAGVTLAEAVATLLPDDCAFAQHYFSLSLADGAAGVKPALEEFVRVSAEMNEELLDISDLGQVPGDPPQYYLIPTETQADLDAVDERDSPDGGCPARAWAARRRRHDRRGGARGLARAAARSCRPGALAPARRRTGVPDRRRDHATGPGSGCRSRAGRSDRVAARRGSGRARRGDGAQGPAAIGRAGGARGAGDRARGRCPERGTRDLVGPAQRRGRGGRRSAAPAPAAPRRSVRRS